MGDHESFVFYLDWVDTLSNIPKDEAFSVVVAIAHYKRTGELQELSPMASLAFAFIRPQIDRDAEKWDETKRVRSEAGKLGGAPKGNQNASKNNQNKQNNQSLFQTSKTTKNNQKQPKQAKQAVNVNVNVPVDVNVDNPPYSPPFAKSADFDAFWASYPRKVGKRNAERAFEKVREPISTLLKALERQKISDQWIRDDGKFIPHPATWLNGERWKDEITVTIPTRVSTPQSSNPFLDLLREEEANGTH